MDTTLKIAIIGAIAVIIGALIKLLGDLISKGSSGGLVFTTIIVILALLGGGALILFLPTPTPPGANPESEKLTELSISATQGWQSSQLHVQRGTELVIKVIGGQWTHFEGSAPYNQGEGDQSYICSPDEAPISGCGEPLPNFFQGGLIGKVGNQVFGVGNGTTLTVQETGILYLRINDGDPDLYGNNNSDEGLSDNDGEIIVRITASR